MKPTLLILAAGMGSRYGGLKQLDGLGPSEETVMDYSIYDAINAGFGKLVFVIRESFDKEFREQIISKYKGRVTVEIVHQELDVLPKGYTLDPKREKPWGTNHAVMVAKDVINEPFAVINADDFYGRDSFNKLAKKLKELNGKEGHYCMVGYYLKNTLSDSGAVARGVCEGDDNAFLSSVVERTHIERVNNAIKFKDEDGSWHDLNENSQVSMNMWGFTPDYFKHSDDNFAKFLDDNKENLKAEYFIPYVVDILIKNKQADVKILDTDSVWFGVTYADDRPGVVAKLKQLVDSGEYPSPLWK